MQFLTISPNPKPQPNQSHFQKIITYYNNGNTIKPSSSMLLHNHYISVKNEGEFTGLLTSLGIINVCSNPSNPFINKKGKTVEYHLENNTIESRKNTTGPHSMFDSSYLTDMGFPNHINNFELSSVGINVEQKLFSGKLVKGKFIGEFVPNRHIQIVYSDDNRSFEMLDRNGQRSLDQNGNPRITHNAFIFNLHLEYNPNFQGSLQAQLQNIANLDKVKNISQDANFEKLFTTEITTFFNTSIQKFYNYCYNPTQNFTILELDKTIQTKKLNNYQAQQKKETEINNILNMTISPDTLEIFPPAQPVPVVATTDNTGVPPILTVDDNPIPDNQADNSADDTDPTSLAAALDNVLKINDNTDANTEAVHSGANSEDASDL